MDLDILKPLSNDNLQFIVNELHKRLPKTIRGHHYIFNYLKNSDIIKSKNVGDRFKPTFYGHRYSELDKNFTFIAITGEKDRWVFCFTLEESLYELAECLRKTSLIDWNSNIKPKISVEIEYFEKIYDVLKEKRNDWSTRYLEGFYYAPRKVVLQYEICKSLPVSTSIEKLTENEAKFINENWPHKYDESFNFIKNALLLNGGNGLYKQNKLVSWIAINDFFALGFLQTIDGEKCKGYGEFILKTQAKLFAKEQNLDPLVYIVHGNIASEKLFKKIGFQLVNEIRWIS